MTVSATKHQHHFEDLSPDDFERLVYWLVKRGGEFDEKQEQMLAETYLFLARSYEELGEYDKGLAACDAGLVENPTYNLLRVEKRIINKQKAKASSENDESFT